MTQVHLTAETVWLRQEQMAQLFGRERSVIGKHVRNVFAEGEVEPDSVCAKFAPTESDGKAYQVGITFTACGFYPEAQKA